MAKTLEKTMAVRLPAEMYERISALAATENRACSAVLRAAVNVGLEELEWQNDLIAYARESRLGRAKTVSAEKLMAEFGIEEPEDPAAYLDEIQ